MEPWQWEELEAQVEDHGPTKIMYILNNDSSARGTGEYEVSVVEIKFEDNLIKVVLE